MSWTAAQPFTVVGGALITLAPTSGPTGISATVSGAGFGAGATVELWMDCAGCQHLGSATVQQDGTFSKAVTIPGTGSGPHPIKAVVGGTSVAEASFVVTPWIRTITPNYGLPGTRVVLEGLGFGADPGAGNRSTTLNRIDLPAQWVPDSKFVSWTPERIEFTLPPDTISGTIALTVAGRRGNQDCFRVASGPGPCISANNTRLVFSTTIRGFRFAPGEEVTLRLDSPGAPAVTVLPSGLKADANGSFTASQTMRPDVYIGRHRYFASAASGSDSTRFQVDPTLTCISPDPGDGTIVTLTGRGFGATREVVNGGVSFTRANGSWTPATITSWSDTSIVAQVPGDAVAGPVVVGRSGPGGGVGSNWITFSAGGSLSKPVAACISPDSGSTGTQVTITGSNFGPDPGPGNRSSGTNHVHAAGLGQIPDANVISWSETQIVLTIPREVATGSFTVHAGSAGHTDGVPFLRTAFASTFTVPSGASPSGHVVEAVGVKADGTPSGDRAWALFPIGDPIRIYYRAGTGIEEQRTSATGLWPSPGGLGTLRVAGTTLTPSSGDRASIRLPSGATDLESYWLGLDLRAAGSGAPADLYRRTGGSSPSFVDANINGAGTSTAITGLVAGGDFTTGTVLAATGGIVVPGSTPTMPRVLKSTDGGQTWGPAQGLGEARGIIGPGRVTLAISPTFATDGKVYAASAGDNGGVHLSSDRGATWTDLDLTNQAFTWVRDVQVFREADTFKALIHVQTRDGQRSAFFRTENFGPNAAWVRVDRHTDVSSYTRVPGFPSPNVIFALRSGPSSDQLLKSSGGGPFQPTLSDPGTEPITTIVPMNDRVVFAGSATGKVWRTADGGDTWTAGTTDLGGRVMSFSFSGNFSVGPPATGIVAASAISATDTMEVWISYDAGVTFARVGSSSGAWGAGGSSLTIAPATGPDAGNGKYSLWVRPRDAANNDLFLADYIDPANPGATVWESLGTPDAVKGSGFTSYSASGVLTSVGGVRLGDGSAVRYLMGRSRNGGPANVTYRANASNWAQMFLPGAPVPSEGDTLLSSMYSSDTLGRLVAVLEAAPPQQGRASRIHTWTDTVEFLTPPALTVSAAGAVLGKADTVRLDWDPRALAAVYQYEIARDPAFSDRLLLGGGTTACPAPEGVGGPEGPDALAPAMTTTDAYVSLGSPQFEAGATYFWHVRVCGVNSAGRTALHVGPWSPARSFAIRGAAALTLNPTSGSAGETVGISLQGFAPNQLFEVRWDNPNTLLAAPTTDGTGSASGSFAVPAGATPGLHIVRVSGVGAAFTVNSPAEPGTPTFRGTVSIGVPGAGATLPPAGYRMDVTLYLPGGSGAVAGQTVVLDGQGGFSVWLPDLEAGAYDVKVKGSHTLSGKRLGVDLPQGADAPALDFGTLRTGDLNGDDLILGADYSILVSNFGAYGAEISASIAGMRESAGGEESPVVISLARQPGPVQAGEIFSLEVRVDTGARPVDAVDVFLRFAPDLVQIESGAQDGGVRVGEGLPVVLLSEVDHGAGRVALALGRNPGARSPAGGFTVATLRFRATAPLSGSVLPVVLDRGEGSASAAFFAGRRMQVR